VEASNAQHGTRNGRSVETSIDQAIVSQRARAARLLIGVPL